MDMYFQKRGPNLQTILLIIAIVLIVTSIFYFVLFFKPSCSTEQCFNEKLTKCGKSVFLNEQQNATWYYSINGYKKDSCNILVQAVRLRTDIETATALVGKTMTCEIPRELAGSFYPETRIEFCHGDLKESIQDLIIKKMHLYIVQSLGQINQSLVQPI